MSHPRVTIPFLNIEEDDNRPFTEAQKLASLYIKGETMKDRASLESFLLAYYPIQFRSWGKGTLLVDLLGLNQVSFKVRLIPDLEHFKRELDGSSINPDEFLRLLRRRNNYFKDFSGDKTYTIKGLLQPPSPEALKTVKDKTVPFTGVPSHFLFNPQLKESDVRTLLSNLDIIKRDLSNDFEQLEKIQKYFNETLDIISKVIAEETANIRDSSVKAKAKLLKDLKKKREMLKKKLDKDKAKMKDRLSRKTRILRDERSKEKRKMTRLSNRLDRYKSKGEKSKINEVKKELQGHKGRHKELDTAIKALEFETSQEIQVTKNTFNSKIKSEEAVIKSVESKARKASDDQKKLSVSITTESKKIQKQINSLIKRKHTKLDSLNKFCLAEKLPKSELYIPFYVFKNSNNRFSHLPPIEVDNARGFFSKFRRILADTLESKIDILISPQGHFTDAYLETALKSMDKNSSLRQIFLQEENQYNIFQSRSAMDQIMKGLVELRGRTIIGDAEYIRLQINLVGRLNEITRQ